MKTTSVSRRVMVVDDELIIANTMALILTQNGHQTKVAYSAEKAIEALDSFDPEVCISDVVMDRLTGVDLALYLAQNRPNCRMLLMSGNAATAEILRNDLPGGLMVPFLPKPVSPQIILDFVNMCA